MDITSPAGGRGRSDDISRGEERSEQSVDTLLDGTSEHGFVQLSPATAAGVVCHGKSTYFLDTFSHVHTVNTLTCGCVYVTGVVGFG